MSQQAFLVNQDNCIGCHACAMACKQQWQTELNWRKVRHFEGGKYPKPVRLFLSLSCQHCEEPSCAQVCPTKRYVKRDPGWIRRQPWIRERDGRFYVVITPTREEEIPDHLIMSDGSLLEDGLVIYNDVVFGTGGRGDYRNHRCIQCGLCEKECPYHVPRKNPEPQDKYGSRWEKCIGCYPLVQQGMSPACARTCMGLALEMKPLEGLKGLTTEVVGFRYEGTKPSVRFIPVKFPLPDNVAETANL
ncbi:MAG: 4Fe-4S dicluster domain-containing protein [Candidatus Brocadiales bacterium]